MYTYGVYTPFQLSSLNNVPEFHSFDNITIIRGVRGGHRCLKCADLQNRAVKPQTKPSQLFLLYVQYVLCASIILSMSYGLAREMCTQK